MGQQRGWRPTVVTILAIWYFLNGVSTFLSGLGTMFILLPGGLGNYTLVLGIVGVLFGALYFAIGWGMLEGQEWSRITAIVLAVISLISYLFAGVAFLIGINIGGYNLSFPGVGAGLIILAIIEGLVIYSLFTPAVEDWFKPPIQEERYTPSVRPVDTDQQPAPPVHTDMWPPPQPRTAWLVMQSGSRSGREFGLECKHNIVGRDAQQCHIVLDDPTVSKQHADVNWENGQFVLHDLVSTNHSFVNGRQVERQSLLDEDEVCFGNVKLIFKQVKPRRTR